MLKKNSWIPNGHTVTFPCFAFPGIELNEKFPLRKILSDSGIVPEGTYTFLEIFNAVKKATNGIRPSIHCAYDEEDKTNTISQIDLCFDKSFKWVPAKKKKKKKIRYRILSTDTKTRK